MPWLSAASLNGPFPGPRKQIGPLDKWSYGNMVVDTISVRYRCPKDLSRILYFMTKHSLA